MPPKPTKKTHPRRALPEDDAAFILEEEVLDVLPIGHTSFWRGIAEGRYPRPSKISPRRNAWQVGQIRRVLAALAAEEQS